MQNMIASICTSIHARVTSMLGIHITVYLNDERNVSC